MNLIFINIVNSMLNHLKLKLKFIVFDLFFVDSKIYLQDYKILFIEQSLK